VREFPLAAWSRSYLLHGGFPLGATLCLPKIKPSYNYMVLMDPDTIIHQS
jgi:hypothetical protein